MSSLLQPAAPHSGAQHGPNVRPAHAPVHAVGGEGSVLRMVIQRPRLRCRAPDSDRGVCGRRIFGGVLRVNACRGWGWCRAPRS